MKYAQILENNLVGNLIEGPEGFIGPEGWIECPVEIEPGAVYDPVEGTFENPSAPVPQVVSRFQARAALLGAGLLNDIEAAISLADPIAQLAWTDALEFRRNSPTLLAICTGLNMTSEQLDDLFRIASTIEA
jgi:hypothetical protein